MSSLSAEEWRLKRARGAIEEYVKGVKRRASDINWVLGVLKGFFGASKGEALMIINQLRNDRTFVWDSGRLRRLRELERRIEAEEW
jgi:hypothetical protein